LELANSYYNIGGLCLYAKYGFEFDSGLFVEHDPDQDPPCFDFPANLPMLVNIESYGTNKAEQITRLFNIGKNPFNKPLVCNLRGNKQKLLAIGDRYEKQIAKERAEDAPYR
jgi:hypothetical protein